MSALVVDLKHLEDVSEDLDTAQEKAIEILVWGADNAAEPQLRRGVELLSAIWHARQGLAFAIEQGASDESEVRQ